MSTLFRVPYGYTVRHFQNGERARILALNDEPGSIVTWDTDDEEPITQFNHTTIFRTSLLRSTRSRNEHALPAHLNYSFSHDFSYRRTIPLTHVYPSRPLVGFCGNATHPVRQRVNAMFVRDSRVDVVIHDSKAFIKLKSLPDQHYWIKQHLRTMEACPFILCCRGAGNWSIRLYETLCAGRIPVMMDTDMVLPKEEFVDWNAIVIKDTNVNRLLDKVVAWHARGPAFLAAAQERCFELWFKMLRPEVFFDTLNARPAFSSRLKNDIPVHAPITVTGVQKCVAALCPEISPSSAWLTRLVRTGASYVDVCKYIVTTHWKYATIVPRIQHLHRCTVGENKSNGHSRTIVRQYFATGTSAAIYVCRHIFHTWSIVASAPLKPVVRKAPVPTTVGVVITTHGNNGVYVRQCIASYYRCVPTDRFRLHVILYINEITDELTPTLSKVFPDLTIVHIQNQTKNGGLTGTWNQGIDWCMDPARSCDLVVLSNDDLFVMSSFVHLLHEAEACRPADKYQSYFGPITNRPGPSVLNQWQHGIAPSPHDTTARLYASQLRHLNGFLMVFPAHVLTLNRYDSAHYFNPQKPFGGNEIEWAERFFGKSPTHRAVVVPHTFVYHTKLQQWHTTPSLSSTTRTTCAYTINTGRYDSRILLNHTSADMPMFYFTDNEYMVLQAIAHNLIPMWVDIVGGDHVRTQRAIKVAPHRFLPSNYAVSVYLDGNCEIKTGMLGHWLSQMWKGSDETGTCDIPSEVQLICWKHPMRTSIQEEAKEVKQLGLDYPNNIQSVLDYMDMYHYDNEQDVWLTETNMLIRRHHTLCAFGDEWSTCIQLCRRDQLSFDFLVAKHGVKVVRGGYAEKPLRRINHSGVGVSRRVVPASATSAS